MWLQGGGGMRGIRRDTVNERAIRILLECILVEYLICFCEIATVALINRDKLASFFELKIISKQHNGFDFRDLLATLCQISLFLPCNIFSGLLLKKKIEIFYTENKTPSSC